jgi:hypothetical protein
VAFFFTLAWAKYLSIFDAAGALFLFAILAPFFLLDPNAALTRPAYWRKRDYRSISDSLRESLQSFATKGAAPPRPCAREALRDHRQTYFSSQKHSTKLHTF